MKKKSKVYSGMFFYKGKQVHGFMAGTQKEVAKAARCELSYIRTYWSTTGNEKELEAAQGAPGKLFVETDQYSGVFEEVQL